MLYTAVQFFECAYQDTKPDKTCFVLCIQRTKRPSYNSVLPEFGNCLYSVCAYLLACVFTNASSEMKRLECDTQASTCVRRTHRIFRNEALSTSSLEYAIVWPLPYNHLSLGHATESMNTMCSHFLSRDAHSR